MYFCKIGTTTPTVPVINTKERKGFFWWNVIQFNLVDDSVCVLHGRPGSFLTVRSRCDLGTALVTACWSIMRRDCCCCFFFFFLGTLAATAAALAFFAVAFITGFSFVFCLGSSR